MHRLIFLCIANFIFITTIASNANFSPTLQTIKTRGYILIGTTGDYQPLTFYDKEEEQFSGFDIDMAEKLAEYLQVKPEFVLTTWPTLARDLRVGKFDIAMSGIDITPARKTGFLFSDAVLHEGKVPLVRCVNKDKYNSLAKIDLYGVRVIENKGGTNEEFAKTHLKHARLIIAANNEIVFAKLRDNNADVMFTDSIEAVYQQKTHPDLCAINPKHPLTQSEKAYMMNKGDVVFRRTINEWLKTLQTNGELKKLQQQWLSG